MPRFLPLFLPSALLDFIPKEEVQKDFGVLKNYFEEGNPEGVMEILAKQNEKWKVYLDKLENPRHLRLFKTSSRIPAEEDIILREVAKGNSLAIELKLISDARDISQRKWPLPFLEKQNERYSELKAIPNSLSHTRTYVGTN